RQPTDGMASGATPSRPASSSPPLQSRTLMLPSSTPTGGTGWSTNWGAPTTSRPSWRSSRPTTPGTCKARPSSPTVVPPPISPGMCSRTSSTQRCSDSDRALAMQLRSLSPALGVEVIGVDLRRRQLPAVRDGVVASWREHHLVLLRDQELSTAQHGAYARWFGTIRPPDRLVHPNLPADADHSHL